MERMDGQERARRAAASGGRNGRSGAATRSGGSPRVTWRDAPADRFEAFRDLASLRRGPREDHAARSARRDEDAWLPTYAPFTWDVQRGATVLRATAFLRNHALGAFENANIAY